LSAHPQEKRSGGNDHEDEANTNSSKRRLRKKKKKAKKSTTIRPPHLTNVEIRPEEEVADEEAVLMQGLKSTLMEQSGFGRPEIIPNAKDELLLPFGLGPKLPDETGASNVLVTMSKDPFDEMLANPFHEEMTSLLNVDVGRKDDEFGESKGPPSPPERTIFQIHTSSSGEDSQKMFGSGLPPVPPQFPSIFDGGMTNLFDKVDKKPSGSEESGDNAPEVNIIRIGDSGEGGAQQHQKKMFENAPLLFPHLTNIFDGGMTNLFDKEDKKPSGSEEGGDNAQEVAFIRIDESGEDSQRKMFGSGPLLLPHLPSIFDIGGMTNVFDGVGPPPVPVSDQHGAISADDEPKVIFSVKSNFELSQITSDEDEERTTRKPTKKP
jgi:hypothetical protein